MVLGRTTSTDLSLLHDSYQKQQGQQDSGSQEHRGQRNVLQLLHCVVDLMWNLHQALLDLPQALAPLLLYPLDPLPKICNNISEILDGWNAEVPDFKVLACMEACPRCK